MYPFHGWEARRILIIPGGALRLHLIFQLGSYRSLATVYTGREKVSIIILYLLVNNNII